MGTMNCSDCNQATTWAERHIKAFRTNPGHDACLVEGCIGNQPLMWVPTAVEVWAETQPRGQTIDFPT